MSPGGAHSSRNCHLEDCAPPEDNAMVHLQSSPYTPDMFLWISLGLCPLAHKNHTTLRCSSHVDDSNLHTIFVRYFTLLSLELQWLLRSLIWSSRTTWDMEILPQFFRHTEVMPHINFRHAQILPHITFSSYTDCASHWIFFCLFLPGSVVIRYVSLPCLQHISKLLQII